MKNTVKLLSTKQLKASVVDLLSANGIILKHQDFISTQIIVNEDLAQEINKSTEQVIFTSKHAVSALLENIEAFELTFFAKKIFCIAGETKKYADSIPNCEIVGVAANASELANLIAKQTSHKTITYFCGNKRLDTIHTELSKNNFNVNEICLYNTEYNTEKIVSSYEGVFFFSPSAADAFFMINKLKADIPCFCIGETTMNAVKKHTNNPILGAKIPSQESVAELALNYFKKL